MRIEDLRVRLEEVRELTEDQWDVLNKVLGNKPVMPDDTNSEDVQAIEGLFDDIVDFEDLDADDVEAARDRLEALRTKVEENELDSLDDDEDEDEEETPAGSVDVE